MSAIFRLLVRFAAIVFAYALACLALSGFIHLLVLGGLSPEMPESRDMLAITSVLTVPVLAAWAGYHLFLPASVLIAAAEFGTARDWLAHAIGGAGATLAAVSFAAAKPGAIFTDTGLIAALTAAGLVAGWVYWFVAGRHSGSWRMPVSGSMSTGS
ncbi:MAG: hypothetical protein K8H74_02310 [Notoacmeibacter sp.]|nr:hypothetical protein [Notoacmeibacter sp.]